MSFEILLMIFLLEGVLNRSNRHSEGLTVNSVRKYGIFFFTRLSPALHIKFNSFMLLPILSCVLLLQRHSKFLKIHILPEHFKLLLSSIFSLFYPNFLPLLFASFIHLPYLVDYLFLSFITSRRIPVLNINNLLLYQDVFSLLRCNIVIQLRKSRNLLTSPVKIPLAYPKRLLKSKLLGLFI